jgi:hypothetical protein
MRVVGRYFAIGATLGSVTSLVALVLIWTWMTIHFGLFGFLIGWIPAGLVAAALWLTMVVFWGPILMVGAMASLGLLLFAGHPRHHWSLPPDEGREPDMSAPPADTAQAPDTDLPAIHQSAEEAPVAPAPTPPPPGASSAEPPPASVSTPSARPAHRESRPSDDLGGDAAATGDTSRKPPR